MKKIQIFGTACAGKSSSAAKLFADLKAIHFNCHLVTEFAKELAIAGKKPENYDQLFITAEQIRREQVCNNVFDVIVTDSPVLLSAAYAKIYNAKYNDLITLICSRYEQESDSLSIFLKPSHAYDQNARFQNEAESIYNEKIIHEVFCDYAKNRLVVNSQQYNIILSKTLEFLNK